MNSNKVNKISCSFSFSENSKISVCLTSKDEVKPSKLDFESFKQLTNDRMSIILPKEDGEYTIKVNKGRVDFISHVLNISKSVNTPLDGSYIINLVRYSELQF